MRPRLSTFRSKLEARYAAVLEYARLAGEVRAWTYEPVTFRLAARTTYTPDFRVVLPDGTVEYHEVKGWHRNLGLSRLKWKLCAEAHPEFVWKWVTRVNRAWKCETFKQPSPSPVLRAARPTM